MGLNTGKTRIAIDTASLVDGDSIAAYLTSAAGDLITSETIGSNEYAHSKGPESHLDGTAYAAGVDYLSSMGVVDDAGNWVPITLNASGEIPVAASVNITGDYAEDSAHVSGDIGLFGLGVRRDTRSSMVDTDGDYSGYQFTANGDMRVRDDDANTTLTAILADTATIDSQTLSIQNTLTALSKAEDAVHSSGDQGIQALAVRKDAQGSNAADGDYTSLQTWSEGSLKVVDVANGAVLQQQVSITNTASQVPASNLASRKSLLVQNTGGAKCWLGSATVTTSGVTAGIEIPPGNLAELDVGPAVAVYMIKNGATGNTVNVLETA